MHFSKHKNMQQKTKVHMYICELSAHTTDTQTHTMEAYTVYTNTDGDKFSAADCGMQQAQYDEMDMADQPQQKLNNTIRRPFPISQSVFLFSYMTPSNQAPPPLIPPLSSILLPPLFISALCSCRILFIFLIFTTLLFPQSPSLPFGFRLKTHTQTDSGTERQPGSDLGSEL